ncbi:MAG: hypothetical protein MUF48_02235 [Pirellulaceae bacterium]|jgi:hypothetical protein|nr:hypothetical protein [Pirellulaceae bacterium]
MKHPLTRSVILMLLVGLTWLCGAIAPRPVRAQEPAAEPPCPAAPEAWQVRIVWLVEGLADDAARVPPPDLDAPMQALSSLGITNLTMAAQLIVQAVENEDFLLTGSAKVNEPCDLEVTGLPFERACAATGDKATDAVRLQIAMVAKAAAGDAARTLCAVRTTVLAPIGQPVVLGIAPVQSKPSVILLLVTPGAVVPAPVAEQPTE